MLFCLVLTMFKLSATDGPNRPYADLLITKLNEPFVPFIDLLQDGEYYQIEITSVGCFNGSRQTLAISRETDGYLVSFGDTVKKLSAAEITAIRDFEHDLQSLSLGGCSTVDTYKLIYGANSFQISDGTCSFHGGRNLMRQLGLIADK